MGPAGDSSEGVSVCFQEEEEGPAEGSKDEPGEQAELKEEAEAPAEDTSSPPPPEAKGAAAPEGEKAAEKDGGDKPEAQVSSRQSEVGLDPEADGTGTCRASCPQSHPHLWRTGGLVMLSLTPSSLPHRSQVRRGRRGLRVPLPPQRKKRSRNQPGSRGWWRRSEWSWSSWTCLTCPRTSWPARPRSE